MRLCFSRYELKKVIFLFLSQKGVTSRIYVVVVTPFLWNLWLCFALVNRRKICKKTLFPTSCNMWLSSTAHKLRISHLFLIFKLTQHLSCVLSFFSSFYAPGSILRSFTKEPDSITFPSVTYLFNQQKSRVSAGIVFLVPKVEREGTVEMRLNITWKNATSSTKVTFKE